MGSRTRARRSRSARGARPARPPSARQRPPLASPVRSPKDTLVALNLAGARLMVETDEGVISQVICRELQQLGFQCAVLAPAPEGASGPALTWRASGFTPQLQRATERVLGRALRDVRIDPAGAPLLSRAMQSGLPVFSTRAPEAAQEVFGGVSAVQLRRLQRLLRLRHTVFAPLRTGGRSWGVLAIGAPHLRASDPAAIEAFAVQASIALDKARLVGELRHERARLESEVARRTEELTRAVEALQELDRRKDNFLANVSHEIRTPLVTVLGYSDLLLSEKLGTLSSRQKECLRVVASSGRRLRNFIDELLEFSRWELTRAEIEKAPVDVPDLLHQAAMSVAPRYAQRGIRLRCRAARGTPPILGDRDRLVQVLTNLLNNAERHCEAGGHVHVAAARVASGVGLAVADDGEGMAPEHLDRIFDRLYQIGDVLKQRERGAGLGLGLTITKSIVEAHGGAIDVRSRLGHGTAFRVVLPAVVVSRLASAAPEAPPPPPRSPARTPPAPR